MDIFDALEQAFDDDDEEQWLAIVSSIIFEEYINDDSDDDDSDDETPTIFDKIPIHPGGPPAATQIAEGLLAGSDVEFADTFRMSKSTFFALTSWLRLHGIEDSKFQTVEHKLMIFLYIVGFGEPQRNASHRFKVAQSTVSSVFHIILNVLVELHKEVVVQPTENDVSVEIELEPKNQAFNGCVGAIDGTLLSAHIPQSQQRRFFDRKGNLSQNVFAAVRFDYTFAYVLAGAEGSMNDKSLLSHALARSFTPPPGRFYLGDAGFGERHPGVVTPFVGERYHLRDYLDLQRRPQTRKELYNLSHARLRSIVERVFGLLKRKFKIVRGMACEYDFSIQVKVVYAVTALWNFLVKKEEAPRGLTPREIDILERAKARAAVWVGRRPGFEVRFNIAVLQWEFRRRYFARIGLQ